jgi:hypothetical protein
MVRLTAYTAALRERGSVEVPNFDPLDGGIEARVLFLFEKPGPKTSEAGGGSGFISRNNDDPTADAIFEFMNDACLPRGHVVIWNTIPWWNNTIKIKGDELRQGVEALRDLIPLLPKLRAIVMVGKKAAKAKRHLESTGRNLELLTSDHPSRRVKASYPDRWKAIPVEWAKARTSIDLSLR